MIQTTVFNTTNKPNLKEKERLIDFLFDNLQEYGDPKSAIEKAVNYALKGVIVKSCGLTFKQFCISS